MNLKAEHNFEQFECACKMTTAQTLKTHLRIHHMKHSPSQTYVIILENKGVQFEISETMKTKSKETSNVVISEKPVSNYQT